MTNNKYLSLEAFSIAYNLLHKNMSKLYYDKIEMHSKKYNLFKEDTLKWNQDKQQFELGETAEIILNNYKKRYEIKDN